jgi:hypothetical protein
LDDSDLIFDDNISSFLELGEGNKVYETLNKNEMSSVQIYDVED